MLQSLRQALSSGVLAGWKVLTRQQVPAGELNPPAP